jgi:hypothetical protein
MRTYLILATMCLMSLITHAQTDNMGIGTTSPDVSAKLEISSTSKGLLTPRMSSNERLAIVTPAEGLLVYDLTTSSFWYFTSGSWTEFITVIPPAPSTILFSSLSQAGLAGTAEAILGSYVIPAATLDANGHFIEVHAFGEMTTDTSVLRLKFGSNVLAFQVNGQGMWELNARVYRVSPTNAKLTGTLLLNGSPVCTILAAAQDFAAAIPFQITGQQNQAVVNGVSVEGFSITRIR